MKKFLNDALALVAPLTSAPTAWAIFAGITEGRTAIPMNDWIAGVGAVSILLVDIAAAILMTDAYHFKQSAKTDDERKMVQPVWWSVLIFGIAISSEIFLSLVIAVVEAIKIWGVLVFPLMTLAGAFAVAARIDLTERQFLRVEARKEIQRKKDEAIQKRAETIARNKARKQERLERLEKKNAKLESKLKDEISWTCSKCSTMNNRDRESCRNCGEKK